MKYFSHEWAAARDEVQAQHVIDDYQILLQRLPGEVGAKIRAFRSQLSLGTAWLDRMMIDSGLGSVAVDLIAGDLQVGYKVTSLTYKSASVDPDSLKTFRKVISKSRVEIRYDEFDLASKRVGSSRFVHRLLFWPREYGEGEIAFEDFDWSLRPIASRQRTGVTPAFQMK